MDGDAKIRACAPPEYFEPAADRAARIISCAPPPRTGTLARLQRCIAESRSHREDGLAKASSVPGTAALDAALAALRRQPAPPPTIGRPNAAQNVSPGGARRREDPAGRARANAAGGVG